MSLLTRACAVLLLVGACATDQQTTGDEVKGGIGGNGSNATVNAGFRRVDLVANTGRLEARHVDPRLVNAWGFVGAEGAFFIAANGTGAVPAYDGGGNASRIRLPAGGIMLEAGITAIAENRSSSFVIHTATSCAAAKFIVSSESGKLIAFNPDLAIPRGGITVVNRSAVKASYKGVAIIKMQGGMRILAADFHNGRIDIFDQNFHLVANPAGAKGKPAMFVDTGVAKGMAPFNVVALDDKVYVMYAQQDADKHDAVKGAGLGVVTEFDLNGKLIREIVAGGLLNAPWGIAHAPANFCKVVGNALLVGNFGDGHIIAIDEKANPTRIIGELEGDTAGQTLVIDGLWGLAFNTAEANVVGAAATTLYFTAGPNDENDGLFGMLTSSE